MARLQESRHNKLFFWRKKTIEPFNVAQFPSQITPFCFMRWEASCAIQDTLSPATTGIYQHTGQKLPTGLVAKVEQLCCRLRPRYSVETTSSEHTPNLSPGDAVGDDLIYTYNWLRPGLLMLPRPPAAPVCRDPQQTGVDCNKHHWTLQEIKNPQLHEESGFSGLF